jgi:uncharacterized protein (DUF1800 family)
MSHSALQTNNAQSLKKALKINKLLSIMNPCCSARWMICILATSLAIAAVGADIIPAPPRVAGVTVSNGQQTVRFAPYPAAEAFRLLSATNISGTFTPKSGAIPGLEWTGPTNGNTEFHRVEVTPMTSNALLSSIVLNRLAYGPTPDEIERVLTGPGAIGPQAFINEQLAPEAINETIDFDVPDTNINWVQVTATGTASGGNFFMYLSGRGSVLIDDVKLVRGTNLSTGQNLLLNEGFEDVLTPPWNVVGSYSTSLITNIVSHSGNNCLQLTAEGGGQGGSTNSVFQTFAFTNNTTYTLSFWYLPDRVGSNVNLTVRLSGSTTIATVPVRPPTPPVPPATIYARLTNSTATIDDLRAWVSYRAVRSKTQLLEVLAQFWDNHFNTQYGKSRQWFSDNYGALTNETELATNFEFRETSKWRQVLMNPNGTFFDLLKISAESPGMMIYLDSVLSSRSTPNENYPRELLELFTMGSDNGYIQNDINELSKAWTGVRVVKKSPENANNLFAPAVASYTNDPGVFVLHFSTNSHNTTVKRLFTNNVVAARFGPPYAGQSYSLILSNGIGTNGWRDMPQVIAHLANLPYTQEFISVKLCQLFVHENFEFGVYDYTDPNLSPEAQLIRDCMATWRTPGPDGRPGNLRALLRTIFNSPMFRSHGSSLQKVKSPFEFAVSAIRALRANVGGTNYTADTDGYDIRTPIRLMGNMNLFDREEPDGYPETGRLWLNTANLCERMRFAQHLCVAPGSFKGTDYTSSGDDNTSNPVLLLKTKTASQTWNDAGAVADFFLGLLFPGEGRANLSVERAAAIEFLNSNDTGTPDSSLFSSLGDGSTAYDGRVRSMVGMLMSSPRFQEQ